MRRFARTGFAASTRGFTLIELMVGMAVGMVVVLVIAQVLSAAEGQKRSATTGADSQVNGALALYTLQRDLQYAGYGMVNSLGALGCEIRARRAGQALQSWTLAPVKITSPGNGAPDTIELLAGRGVAYSTPVPINGDTRQADNRFPVDSALGVHPGDLMLAVPVPYDAANWCTVFEVSDPSVAANPFFCGNGPPDGTEVRHDTCNNTPWNSAGAIFPAAGYSDQSFLLRIARVNAADATRFEQPFYQKYEINNNALQLTTYEADGTSPADTLYPQIVGLRALYGKDTNADGAIDLYDNVTPTTNAGWQQVRAVRVAIVARSSQYEKGPVTAANPQWDVGTGTTVTGSTACGASKCLTFNVSGLADWDHYRYKVFGTVVPLRNIMWGAP